MRIVWVVNDRFLRASPAGLYSSMASYRYRAIIPGAELGRRGLETSIIGLAPGPESYDGVRRHLANVDVAVFGKLFEATPVLPALVADARQSGTRAIADICDEFKDRSIARIYREVLPAVDAVSASSAFLARRIAEATARRPVVIHDPYEGARGIPRWSPGARLEAVWFGNETNLRGLDGALEGLASCGIPMRLVVVTALGGSAVSRASFHRPRIGPTLELEWREWSLETTAQALQACDVVLLPIDRTLNFYLAKGPDRMVESLWAGRFVVSHPMPAYAEFREWAWIGEDIAAGLQWALANPAAVVQRIEAAQAHIAARYAPSVVADSWAVFLADVRQGRRPRG